MTINFNEQPRQLAFYSEVIGEIPQMPTTCFSKSPSVIPMWSHYAQNLQGFVIELDEENLASHFPKSGFGDVNYRDKPDDSIQGNLYRAYGTLKPRHVYFLQQIVFNTAYYTKSTCWSYELERRMIIDPTETRNSDGLILIDIPLDSVSAIICGPRAVPETQKMLSEQAERINCGYFDMKIGHSSTTSFFIDKTGAPYMYEEGELCASSKYCTNCKEPLNNADAQKCSWCMIDESHKTSAAERNPYRMLADAGILESYLDDMAEIGRKRRKK